MYTDSFASDFIHINLKNIKQKKSNLAFSRQMTTFTIPFNDTIVVLLIQQWAIYCRLFKAQQEKYQN